MDLSSMTSPSRRASMPYQEGVESSNRTAVGLNAPPGELQTKCLITNQTILYMSLYCTIIFLVFAGNIFILKTLMPLRKNRNTRYRNIDLFIVYLASFDLLATLMITVDVYENLTCFSRWPFGVFACKMVYPCYHISLSMTVCILAIMSIDRCRSITRPLKEKFSKRAIHQAVFVSFLISTGLQWYQFTFLGITDEGNCNTNKKKMVFAVPRLFAIFVRDIVFLVTFTVTSIVIYRSLRKQEEKIRHFHWKSKRGSSSVVSMLLVMEIAFILLVMPYDVYDCAMLLSRIVPGAHVIQMTTTVGHVDKVLSMLQMSNSFANCFIYAKMHKQLNKNRASNYGSQYSKKLISTTYVGCNTRLRRSVVETRLSTDFDMNSPTSSLSSKSSHCMNTSQV